MKKEKILYTLEVSEFKRTRLGLESTIKMYIGPIYGRVYVEKELPSKVSKDELEKRIRSEREACLEDMKAYARKTITEGEFERKKL